MQWMCSHNVIGNLKNPVRRQCSVWEASVGKFCWACYFRGTQSSKDSSLTPMFGYSICCCTCGLLFLGSLSIRVQATTYASATLPLNRPQSLTFNRHSSRTLMRSFLKHIWYSAMSLSLWLIKQSLESQVEWCKGHQCEEMIIPGNAIIIYRRIHNSYE